VIEKKMLKEMMGFKLDL
jgi:hypothetical protein